jgi:uncharacterized protein
MSLQLSPVETRILGCLLEKERTTPDTYPLSLNGLTAACNQTTNRDPIVAYDEKTVESGLDSLREKKLASVVWGAGARVQKYRHNLLDTYNLDHREVALLCVLMLRGPQTPGDLRARAERLHPFASVQEVEECLQNLCQGDRPLARVIPPRPGQKEKRYVQLLSGEPEIAQPAAPVSSTVGSPATPQPDKSRLEQLEAEVGALKAELAALREEFAGFRKQFE